jgi:hypothetical protein
LLDNASVISIHNEERGSAVLKCNWGYLLATGVKNQTLHCVGGHWEWPERCYRELAPNLLHRRAFWWCSSSGTSCGRLNAPPGMTLSTDITLSGIDVTATCAEGFWFVDHVTSKVLFCDETKAWNNTLGRCERRCPNFGNGKSVHL